MTFKEQVLALIDDRLKKWDEYLKKMHPRDTDVVAEIIGTRSIDELEYLRLTIQELQE
jgi:hypothetical protein